MSGRLRFVSNYSKAVRLKIEIMNAWQLLWRGVPMLFHVATNAGLKTLYPHVSSHLIFC